MHVPSAAYRSAGRSCGNGLLTPVCPERAREILVSEVGHKRGSFVGVVGTGAFVLVIIAALDEVRRQATLTRTYFWVMKMPVETLTSLMSASHQPVASYTH